MKILVVDDQQSNRELLKWILEDSGHICVEAENGQRAVEIFPQVKPDLVLMDVMMPVMDGYEATRQIKQLVGEMYIPVIFLTAMSDDYALIECLEAGGDDFLSKPIDEVILQAKIKAHTRTQELNEQVRKKNDELTYLHNRLKQEHEMGEHVLSNAMRESFFDAPNVQHFLSPMSMFNGDILLVTPKSSGGLYILLGDFTGHGLAASIGAIPLSQVFFAMSRKNFPVSDIVSSLNKTLNRFLPSHMFCALILLEINQGGNYCSVWAGGLPDAYVVTPGKGITQVVESQNMPLGVLDENEFESDVQIIKLEPGDKLLLYTDGIIESSNVTGEMFGTERLNTILSEGTANVMETVLESFHQFKGDTEQDDDISIVEITAEPIPEFSVLEDRPDRISIPWTTCVTLSARELQNVSDPVKHIVAMLPRDSLLGEHKDIIHTVLKELYSNALEHGILGLDSRLKFDEEGFEKYYQLRKERLAIAEGIISITLSFDPKLDANMLKMTVKDSGVGFDPQGISSTNDEVSFGRGVSLVASLCEKIEFSENGTRIDVSYSLQ
jgi:CheY-like chemotaxis protein